MLGELYTDWDWTIIEIEKLRVGTYFAIDATGATGLGDIYVKGKTVQFLYTVPSEIKIECEHVESGGEFIANGRVIFLNPNKEVYVEKSEVK